jgi:hypothetical protein
MNSKARWTIGILLALVIGLGVGLAVVAGDDSGDEPETVTVSTQETTETEPIEPETTPTETQPSNGGETAPSGEPDGSGGLGFD